MKTALFLLCLLCFLLAGCAGKSTQQPDSESFTGLLGPFNWPEGHLARGPDQVVPGPSGEEMFAWTLVVSNSTENLRLAIAVATGEPIGILADDGIITYPFAGLASLAPYLPFVALRHVQGDFDGDETFMGMQIHVSKKGQTLTVSVVVEAAGGTFTQQYRMIGSPNGWPIEIRDSARGDIIWTSTHVSIESPRPNTLETAYRSVGSFSFATPSKVPPADPNMPFSPQDALEILTSTNEPATQFFSDHPEAALVDGFYTEGLAAPGSQELSRRWILTFQGNTEQLLATVWQIRPAVPMIPGNLGFVEQATVNPQPGAYPIYATGDRVVQADSIYLACKSISDSAGAARVTLHYLDLGGTGGVSAGGLPLSGLVAWGCGDALVGAPVWDAVSGCLKRARLTA